MGSSIKAIRDGETKFGWALQKTDRKKSQLIECFAWEVDGPQLQGLTLIILIAYAFNSNTTETGYRSIELKLYNTWI